MLTTSSTCCNLHTATYW